MTPINVQTFFVYYHKRKKQAVKNKYTPARDAMYMNLMAFPRYSGFAGRPARPSSPGPSPAAREPCGWVNLAAVVCRRSLGPLRGCFGAPPGTPPSSYNPAQA